MSIWSNVKAWWHVYVLGAVTPTTEPEEETAEEWLARKFPLESEWEDD